MAMLTLQNPTIAPGSTILVTGANGLIASHVVDQTLAAGYQVRAAVRNTAKCSWMERLYSDRHGPGRFELIQVASPIKSPEDWAAAVKGVSGIAHLASGIDISVQDHEKALEEEMSIHTTLLEAAKQESSIKAFVMTSSAWAAWTPVASKRVKLSEWTWNKQAIQLAKSNASPQEKGLAHFMALKTRMEQDCWEWVKKEKPTFTFKTILLDTVLGECLDPKNQGVPSTAGMVYWVWDGSHRDFLNRMQPQWHVDTRDAGLLYLAALTRAGADGERIFAFGDRYSWFQVAKILKGLYPDKEIAPLKDNGSDQTEVPNERGAELLKALRGTGWTSLEESVRANATSFLKLENSST